MIETILSFSLRSMECSAVFVAYYLLVLKNARMHRFNRIYLLAAVLLSLVLPFVKLDVFNTSPVAVPDFPLLEISGKGAEEAATTAAAAGGFNWAMVLVAAYFAIGAVMVLKLAAKFVWIYLLKRKGEQTSREGFQLIKTDDPRAPFSFMNMLFWPTHMRQDSPEGERILMHELAHIRQHHTVDKVLMLLMLAACWLNPFNWLMKKELWLQHEFLADRNAIKDGDGETFARMLLYSVTNSTNRSVISPFFQSPVKRRLRMLTQPGRNTFGFLRRFLSVPVLLMAIFLVAAKTEQSAKVARSPKKIVMVLDAGHGGDDAGGKGIYGHQEKDITLTICNKLVALSGEYNIGIITTRNENVYPTLKERLHTSNNTDAALFLSVHVNKSTPGNVVGNSYELGVDPKSRNYDKTILLASAIASKLETQKLPVKVVDRGKAYVLRENNHPALMIECGNLDDADNMALLSDEDRTEVLCRNILSGIVDYNARLATR